MRPTCCHSVIALLLLGAAPVQAAAPGDAIGKDIRVGILTARATRGTVLRENISGMNNPTDIYGIVQYNTTTCTEISPGSWAVTKKPHKGTATNAQVQGTLGSGPCASTVFTFGALIYDWTKATTKDKDGLAATWSTPDFTVPERFRLNLIP